jgi:hypothetical protein
MTRSAQLELANDREVPLRRVQLDLPPRAFDRLQQLKSETEASTYAEVIRNALKLYAAAIEIEKAGKEFMVKNKDGTIYPLLIFR